MFLSCGGHGVFIQDPNSVLPGGVGLSRARGGRGSAATPWGLLAASSPTALAGDPGPSHASPGMLGCFWKLSKSVTFPLD